MDEEFISTTEALSDGRSLKKLYSKDRKLLSESVGDSTGREVERKQYKGDGTVLVHNFYEYEASEYKHKRLKSYDGAGRLVMEHERGKRPVIYDQD